MFLRKLLKILQNLAIAILIFLLLLNLYTIISRLIFNNTLPMVYGFGYVVVVSGSMEPTLEIGDMLLVHEENKYHINDIVTYRWEKTFVTHRIIGMPDGAPDSFITKGDFNNTADEPIPASIIVGKVLLRIPMLGNLTLFLKTPVGIFTMILLIFLIYRIPHIAGRLKRTKE